MFNNPQKMKAILKNSYVLFISQLRKANRTNNNKGKSLAMRRLNIVRRNLKKIDVFIITSFARNIVKRLNKAEGVNKSELVTLFIKERLNLLKVGLKIKLNGDVFNINTGKNLYF